MLKKFILLSTILFFISLVSYSNTKEVIIDSILNNSSYLNVSDLQHYHVEEYRYELHHSFQPWQETEYHTKGDIFINKDVFLRLDTLLRGENKYPRITQFTDRSLYLLNFGQAKPSSISKNDIDDFKLEIARYSPTAIFYLLQHDKFLLDSHKHGYILTTEFNNQKIDINVNNSFLIDSFGILYHDELFGDTKTIVHYKYNHNTSNSLFPNEIIINKYNYHVRDSIVLKYQGLAGNNILINDTTNVSEDIGNQADNSIEIRKEIGNENLLFLNIIESNSRVMVAEFEDFLFVAESPLSSEIGAEIIKEATDHFKGKKIKYLSVSHYHPHYLGGIRPFVNHGSQILCSPHNEEYIKYIAAAERTIEPDILQNNPRTINTATVIDSLTIKDKENEIILYHIGSKSEHSIDFIIYYLPKEKILFEADLIWINNENTKKEPSKRQIGLYNTIKSLGIDVDTIYQSWPLENYNVKSILTFKELEQSIQ